MIMPMAMDTMSSIQVTAARRHAEGLRTVFHMILELKPRFIHHSDHPVAAQKTIWWLPTNGQHNDIGIRLNEGG